MQACVSMSELVVPCDSPVHAAYDEISISYQYGTVVACYIKEIGKRICDRKGVKEGLWENFLLSYPR